MYVRKNFNLKFGNFCSAVSISVIPEPYTVQHKRHSTIHVHIVTESWHHMQSAICAVSRIIILCICSEYIYTRRGKWEMRFDIKYFKQPRKYGKVSIRILGKYFTINCGIQKGALNPVKSDGSTDYSTWGRHSQWLWPCCQCHHLDPAGFCTGGFH